MHLFKAHAYGNDFLYVLSVEAAGAAPELLAREMCDRHMGIGADGLILYERTPDGASMRLFNADGSRAEVSGNGVRGLAALLLRDDERDEASLAIHTESGTKLLHRTGRNGGRQTFRASMGLPAGVRKESIIIDSESVDVAILSMGNPQCVILGVLPERARFERLGAALERHPLFPEGTNVEFAHVDEPGRVRVLIWERGVGPTTSSGTGCCAALVAAAAFGGASRTADLVSEGGTQRVEWLDDSVYLTGWAELVCEGNWLRQIRRTE
jgi:diaminopimelate epimerase